MAEKYALKVRETDLAFNPHQLRGPNGRWVSNPAESAAKMVEKATRAKHVLAGKHAASHKEWPVNPKTVNLNGSDYDLDSAVKMVGEVYEWPEMDKEGGGDKTSLREEHKAQIVAKSWASSTGSDSSDDRQFAASLWQQYQNPDLYGKINNLLRGGKPGPNDPSKADVEKYANVMFEQGGYTTMKDMTVYRALKSGDGHPDWSKSLQPGVSFTDNGIVSTTAQQHFAEGWLMNNATGEDTARNQPSDVVVELKVPIGSRIVGGDPQFIETMLPPGTQFKVTSTEQKTSKAVNPLDHTKAKITYTHVVAEVTR